MKTIIITSYLVAFACLVGSRIYTEIGEKKLREANQPREKGTIFINKLDGTVRVVTVRPDGERVEWVQTPPSKRGNYQMLKESGDGVNWAEVSATRQGHYQMIDPDRVRQEWCDATLQFAPRERTAYQRRFQN